MSDSEDQAVSLSDWIATVRAELASAQRSGNGDEIRFRVNMVELDIETVTTRERDGKGSIKLWLAEGGISGKKSHGATQRMKLTLSALNPEGEDLVIADDDGLTR